jgi:NADH-quinone oxidoreductase subunit G
MQEKNHITVNGLRVPLNGERNLLEVARAAKVEIPTFCYHSELSVYGACRLCMVEVEGRGLVASCSTAPEPDMVVRTNTAEIREMRRTIVELLLANHPKGCLTCAKSPSCQLLDLASKLGVDDVPFQNTTPEAKLDTSSAALVRDPSKCVLCGDCVRMWPWLRPSTRI